MLKTQVVTGLVLLAMYSFATAEVIVIGNMEITDTALSRGQVASIFLGKSSKLPGGGKVVPVDQDDGNANRDEFYAKVVNKDATQLKAYWSRLIFTGKGQPPQVLAGDIDILRAVAARSDAIGYVSGRADLSGVKVLLTVP